METPTLAETGTGTLVGMAETQTLVETETPEIPVGTGVKVATMAAVAEIPTLVETGTETPAGMAETPI